MSELEDRARERIAQLRKEIEVLEEYLRMTAQTKALLDQRPGAFIHPQVATQPLTIWTLTETERQAVEHESPAKTRITDNPKPAVLIPAAIKILRENGRPMSRRQLHEALSDRGLVVRGAEPTKTLGTILWRAKDEIDSVEGRGYWPKGDPLPRQLDLSDTEINDMLG